MGNCRKDECEYSEGEAEKVCVYTRINIARNQFFKTITKIVNKKTEFKPFPEGSLYLTVKCA